MELTREEQLHAQVIERAWNDADFKRNLIANPVETIEAEIGQKINIPEGEKLVVEDQSDDSKIYLNIPRKIDVDSLQLTEEQLEMVAGGITPTFIAFGYGFMAGVAVYAATSSD
ncbi:class IIb bacteriocin, lactobin A/cerein 7B family [Aquimarina brevivitae]|uniref:Lactobin A/cerein 7B family class IIb bacteriocin n=1 Tax=Aquimarina brevivitae TaxID=323412 RepID=A0A4Q7PH18_9FLAO|nr:class IIb bacteriocin, lactobin A/cerein 7B family [Aquimarina brevivitae]RZS99437.1 lactobin A/cerein 7B family class IIb bacteriocin [Aquimarina brevivitae]